MRASSLLAFIAILLGIAGVTQAQVSECVINETACTCAPRDGSGSCMRHQGGGQCLMGDCNVGYKCDCMGFEMCSIAKCSKYTTLGDVVPSEEQPFSCHLTENAGTCTSFSSLLDTAEAAVAAKQEATDAVSAVDNDYTEVLTDIADMQKDRAEMNDMMEKLDELPGKVTPEERHEVQQHILDALEQVTEAQKQMVEVQKAIVEATEADFKVSNFTAQAKLSEQKAIEAEAQLKSEESKVADKEKCETCKELKDKIKALRTARRQAAIEAGTWVKKTREAKQKSASRKKAAKKNKAKSAESRKKCVDRAKKILARLNSPVAQS